ncbi:MAG: T9SS type A sorting domain-containing protein [Bacteroidetes bacterium]|nr:T9SS type A sorting domain-containing protein [Bacteroidota bacterium]
MNRIILLLLTLSLSFGKAFSQCTEINEPKVLLVGDSWAFFMNTESTINSVFKTWGHSNYKFISNATLSVNGAQTDDFQQPGTQAEILNQLTLNPTIEVVHLSIGGNDFLGDWKVSNTQAETDTLIAHVFVRLDSVIRFIKSCKPGIKVLWSGYVYTNFQEVISGAGGLGSTHPFYGTWQGMEFPTALQINTLQNDQSARMNIYAAADPQVEYFEATGLMQYLYGQNPALSVPPGGTYPPYSVTMPLGDPNYPSPKSTMRDYIFTKDCYHLSTQGYKDLIGYNTQKFYHKYFMDDLYLLAENSAQTGSVSMNGVVTDTLFLGETAGDQFSTVLSFNTTSMADTTLKKASIFLRRKELTGTNPITGSSIVVKMKSGNFGATVNVEAADYTDAGDASGAPCLFGSNTANGDWIRLDLPVSILSHINHNAATQFVISTPGASNGRVRFYDSTDPELAPVLNLAYGETPSGITEAASNKEFYIYPNPTSGLLTIEKGTETITHLEICNLLGEVVLVPNAQQHTINLSTLATGMYMLNITTKNGKSSQRVFKD